MEKIGMNKILIPKEGNSTFTMIYAKTGSRCEPASIKGISHFLEHLMFKGTRTRTAKQISYDIEKYGAQLNAWTDYELTAYWIKSANKYKKDAEDILMDMLHNSFFPQKEIDKEREVILQEMKMYEDKPRSAVSEIHQKALFEESDGLYLPIIGTEQSLANIDRTLLLDYYRTRYKDLTFVQIGDVPDYRIDDTKSLDNISNLPAIKNIVGRNNVIVKRPGISQANVIIGNVIKPYSSSNLDTLILMDLLEGVMNNMSGRLFSELREENNLCYSVYFGIGIYSCNTPNWYVSISLDAGNINKAYDLILDELTREITNEEIKYAVTKKIGEKAIQNDSLNYVANTIAYSDLKNLDYMEYLSNYENLAKAQAENLQEFVNSINFKNNVVAQLIPE
jgi:predicted Zn-dependent peptidase